MLLAQFSNASREDGTDRELWVALLHGQREALSELFKRFHSPLYNYGLKMVPDEDLVQEAIQQLFLNLWDRHEYLSIARSVKAYLLSSLRRVILKQIRQKKQSDERNWHYIEDQLGVTFPVEDLFIRQEIIREKREQLQMGIEALTPRQREAIFLKFYHGLTNKELAEVMEINYQCVRNLLYEALKTLRFAIEATSYQD